MSPEEKVKLLWNNAAMGTFWATIWGAILMSPSMFAFSLFGWMCGTAVAVYFQEGRI
jgi:hypothetical protein